jgi:hypothetical protein
MSCENGTSLAVSRAQDLAFRRNVNGNNTFFNNESLSNLSGRPNRCFPIQINSSTGSAGPLGVITALTIPINVVSTSINTCCIGKSDILVQFTSTINIPVALTTTLVFQVYRSSCIGNAVPVGSPYTFALTAGALTSQSFAFTFLDNDVAPGTYTYSVQLISGTTTTVAGVSISNATLSIVAVADN